MTATPLIVITEFMAAKAVDALAARFELVYDPTLVDEPTRLQPLLSHCRALIVRNRTQLTADLLADCAQLQVVGRLGVGLDNIDLEACRERGVDVIPATGANTVAVAEYVIAGLLMLQRGAYHAQAQMLAGGWPRQHLQGREVAQKQLGLIGFGAIARAVAQRARALDMRIAAYDPLLAETDPAWAGIERHTDLSTLLASSDAISLHIPLTEQTRHMLNAGALAQMPSHAVLINTARGGVVDEAALAEALCSGRLAGAMLDVFEQEPLPAGAGFDKVPNLLLTPHIAGVTAESNERVSWMIAERVTAALEARAD